MTRSKLLTVLCALSLLAAGPATRPIRGIADVDSIYRDRVAASDKLHRQALTAAAEERIRNLRTLEDRALQLQDVDAAAALREKIRTAEEGAEQSIDDEPVKMATTPAKLKKFVVTTRRFMYSLVDAPSHDIVLEDDGTVGAGAGQWEQSWSVRVVDRFPRIILTGEIGSIELTEGIDGVFRGHWNGKDQRAVSMWPDR